MGIDHSALSVRQLEVSIDFYQSLGLHVAARTLNQGREQENLDGVADPLVDVVAVALEIPTPHIELLHYRTRSRPHAEILAINDTAASRLILSAIGNEDSQQMSGKMLQDPDGHFLEVPDTAER